MNAALPPVPAAAATAPSVPAPRLVRAAHEFEAQMMKELLAPLNRTPSLAGDGSSAEDDSGSGGVYGEFASEALGRALSERGGFGVADSIVKQLSHSGNRNAQVPLSGNRHRDTVIKSDK